MCKLNIRPAGEPDRASLIEAIGEFRMALARLRNHSPTGDKTAAAAELDDYIERGFPIYVAEESPFGIVGYMVCRIDEDVLWVESLYVAEAFRRKGVAAQLYDVAERMAKELGGNAPYNWVDPHNDAIIRFLKKRGYDVLNLIELRKKEPGETLTQTVKVGGHEYYQQ
ncbi:MAG: GNAT family N-acetyltransferase [Chloroflexota bacterium]